MAKPVGAFILRYSRLTEKSRPNMAVELTARDVQYEYEPLRSGWKRECKSILYRYLW